MVDFIAKWLNLPWSPLQVKTQVRMYRPFYRDLYFGSLQQFDMHCDAQGVMGGEENEQMGVGQVWVCLYVENEFGGEEDEIIWPYRPKKQH